MKLLTGPRRSRRRFWLLAVPVLLVTVVLAFGGDSDESDDLVFAVRPRHDIGRARESAVSTPLAFARRAVAEVTGNLFASHSWYVAPPPPPSREVAMPSVPTAPPLPFAFLGSYGHSGDKTVYFLVKDDRVFDVHIGDVLEKTYSIDAVENGQLKMTYLPLGTRQTLQVGGPP
jgi:hypothetical protein